MKVPLVNRELWKAGQNEDIIYPLEGYILNVGNIKGVIAMAKKKRTMSGHEQYPKFADFEATHLIFVDKYIFSWDQTNKPTLKF